MTKSECGGEGGKAGTDSGPVGATQADRQSPGNEWGGGGRNVATPFLQLKGKLRPRKEIGFIASHSAETKPGLQASPSQRIEIRSLVPAFVDPPPSPTHQFCFRAKFHPWNDPSYCFPTGHPKRSWLFPVRCGPRPESAFLPTVTPRLGRGAQVLSLLAFTSVDLSYLEAAADTIIIFISEETEAQRSWGLAQGHRGGIARAWMCAHPNQAPQPRWK